MDHFESIIAVLLEADHFWVRRSFKIDLTGDEKRQVGKPAMPRPEIDLLGFNFTKNEVLALEVKSFLNSPGVRLEDLKVEHNVQEGRYKLFTSRPYRELILKSLKQNLINHGMANSETIVRLGLAAGKVYQKKSEPAMTQSNLMKAFLEGKGFVFWSPEDIRGKVKALASRAYENDPVIIASKILFPEPER